MNDQNYTYYAFISYQRDDEEWARWLHYQLEHYHLPVSVEGVDKEMPKQLRPLFLDELELAGGNLPEKIAEALVASRYLIVLCSPSSAKSQWVDKEISTFITLGRVDRIIPVIIGGVPYAKNDDEECFPSSLRKLRATNSEQLAINVKSGREVASVKIVAQMLGLKFDMLWNRYEREKEEERRRLLEERRRLQRIESRYLSEKAEELIALGDSYVARLLALESLPKSVADTEDRPYVAEAEHALRHAIEDNGVRFICGDTVRKAIIIPDGKYAFIAVLNRRLYVYDVLNGSEVCCLNLEDNVEDMVLQPNGKLLSIVDVAHRFMVWDYERNEMVDVRSLSIPHNYTHLKFALGDSFLIGKEYRGNVWLHDVHNDEGGEIIQAGFHQALCSRDANLIAYEEGNNIVLWSLEKQNVVQRFVAHTDGVASIDISPCGTFMVSGGHDRTVRLWDIATGRCLHTFKEFSHSVMAVRFGGSSDRIVAVDYSNTLRCFSIVDKQCYYAMSSPVYMGRPEFVLNDSHILVTSGTDVRLIDISRYSAAYVLDAGLHCAAFSPNGEYLVTVCTNGVVKVWSVTRHRYIREFVHKGVSDVTSAAFSPDNEHYALSGSRTYLYDIHSDKPIYEWGGEVHLQSDVSFDRSGNEVMCYTPKNVLLKWSVQTGELISEEYCHIADFVDVNADMVNERYVHIAKRFDLLVIDCDDTANSRVLVGHTDLVFPVSHSVDGRYLVSASRNEVKVWDFELGICIHTIAMQRSVSHIGFTPDNSNIVLVYGNGEIDYVEFEPLQDLIDETRARFERCPLSREERRRYYLE